jgi:hypothetical protein
MILDIILLGVLIWCIALTVNRRHQVPDGQSVIDPLIGNEKLSVWIICLFNPIWGGAIMYYGWKKKLPEKAKQANSISFKGFFISIILYILYFIFFGGGFAGWQASVTGTSLTPASTSTIDISQWSSTDDSQYGFVIYYPDWQWLGQGTTTYAGVSGYYVRFGTYQGRLLAELETFPATASETIPEAFQQITSIDPNTVTTSSLTIASETAIYYQNIPSSTPYSEALFLHGGRLWGLINYSVDEKTFKAVASSLQFNQP